MSARAARDAVEDEHDDDEDDDDDDDDDDQSPRADAYLFLAPKWLQRHCRSSMPF